MKIRNFKELAANDLRKTALNIAEAGLEAIDTAGVVRKKVSLSGDVLKICDQTIPLAGIGRIIVAGIGKCAAQAAAELENILGGKITDGFIIAIGDIPPLKHIKAVQGTHPFPSKVNMDASQKLLDLLSNLSANDLVIFLTTGGGSTLLCLPEDGNFEREALIFNAFMKAAAPIQDINTVRKHMSKVRGGFLAKAMYPARVAALIFNDVPGSDDMGFIASGPTVRDTTTVADADRVLEKYGILKACGLDNCGLMETPKEEKYFANVKNVIVVSNTIALEAMKHEAEKQGLEAKILDAGISGEARDVGRSFAESVAAAPSRTALLWGGETTVTVKHSGKGGRNQEFALGGLAAIPDDGILMAISSDGHDNSDIGGAFCDKLVKETVRKLNLDPQTALEENQSYDFSKAAGNYLDTGETGSNVSDLIIGIKK